jgi:deoxycytidylate deaminase
MVSREKGSRRVKDQLKWDRRYLDLAKFISGWSKDPSTKTGCVIVKNNRVVSTGWYSEYMLNSAGVEVVRVDVQP